MLITSLLPLLSRYSLGLDLTASDETVTLTIIPRKAAGAKHDLGADEVRPISITATAAEIDDELARGEDGALGQLIVARKSLGDQLAEQRATAEAATGQLCWGNIRKPKTLSAAAMPEFESAVFDSWSTHPNPGQELTVTGKGGLISLWDDLAARNAQRFPVKRLRPFVYDGRRTAAAEPLTLSRLITGSAQA